MALVGNPNSGKTSLFNKLTGLNQKVGNFPGVTVDKKTGRFSIGTDGGRRKVELVDLPGTYSLQPRSQDERVAATALNDPNDPDHPELVLIVVDASHLKTSLYLALQVLELGLPAILVLNMSDQLKRISAEFDMDALQRILDVPVVLTNAREGVGVEQLRAAVAAHDGTVPSTDWSVDGEERHLTIRRILQQAKADAPVVAHAWSQRMDDLLTHPVGGIFIFLALLGIMFQSIYSWAIYPMEWIENMFGFGAVFFQEYLPDMFLTRLWVEGIWAGLGGVVVFIPQIAFLFLFVELLEQTGYMARVSFLTDHWMRRFGMQGRSVVPLIGGVACAVPAIMAARTISNRKERLITILVTPFMSCSARLPVYTLLIALVIPLAWQGLTLLFMYLLGLAASLVFAYILSKNLKTDGSDHFLMELPDYRLPRISDLFLQIVRKVWQFVRNAGKIIIGVSIVLWLGASYGPPERFDRIEERYAEMPDIPENRAALKAELLENSYIGIAGRSIEPAIAPLGYDWKIGIALITSFAAREVFVGTMSTIYSVGEVDELASVREKMQAQTKPDGSPLHDLPFGLSLLVFYAFAMQCMSTLAVVKTETGSWKWPLFQFVVMTGLAYVCSLAVYQLSSAMAG